jgi:glycosyltransferase A (GT-A) superfamily protein (DUF2064 family)
MTAYDPDETEAPLDPAAERLRRKLARLLMISGGFMVLGLIAVFAAILYRLGGGVEAFPPDAVEASLPIPPEAQLLAADLDGGRALLTLQTRDGPLLILMDLSTGRIAGRYTLSAD